MLLLSARGYYAALPFGEGAKIVLLPFIRGGWEGLV